jgi:hypothetical protein
MRGGLLKPTQEASKDDAEAEREFWFDLRRAFLAVVASLDDDEDYRANFRRAILRVVASLDRRLGLDKNKKQSQRHGK